MNFEQIDPRFPVWKITDFYIQNTNFTEQDNYNQGSSHDHLRIKCSYNEEFILNWDTQTKLLQGYIRNDISSIEEVRQMWMKGLSNFIFPSFKETGEVLKDKEGFKMSPHIDNRFIFGVLIINLQDNPIRSGTYFTDLEYGGPTQKGTGIFMLNNWNTRHSISNLGPGTRTVGYQTIHIRQINGQ